DLSSGPLLRARLLRLAADEHVAVLVMHHIVSDGWSMGVLVEELGTLYSSFTRGEESPLAELPVQYADYAIWQREHLSGQVLDAQLAYWKGRLAGVPVLELPTDRPRPAARTHAGATHAFTISSSAADAVRALGRNEGATTFMTLLAAFQVLLSRYANQEDVAVGTPVAGRTRSEVENLIGFFVNTLVVRTDLSGAPTFRRLLGRVREVVLGAFSHQDAPFERVVEAARPGRSLSHAPLFQVMFALQNAPAGELSLGRLALEAVRAEAGTAKFDLLLSAEEGINGELRCLLEYDAELFDEATARRMAGHYRMLLEAAAADPDLPVAELPLLTAEEARQLSQWNSTSAPYEAGACLHELFERQAAETPGAVAVVAGDVRLTYAELNARANRLARHLRALGVGPESRVGVCLGRTPDLVAALLGVLKAGGAYVPLDPAYPQDRLAFMLEDAEASVVLTQESLLDVLPRSAARVLRLESVWEAADSGAEGETDLGSVASPDNLAYVIYTSGSTGRPKGVAIEHRSAAAFLAWAHRLFTPAELS
ncbi:MAG TPA: condensation domain-containing protein, partial [Pyrinomonadaceae bacterium]